MSLRRGVRFVLHGRGRGGGGDTNVLHVFNSNVFLSFFLSFFFCSKKELSSSLDMTHDKGKRKRI
jgi:hypothetical protein